MNLIQKNCSETRIWRPVNKLPGDVSSSLIIARFVKATLLLATAALLLEQPSLFVTAFNAVKEGVFMVEALKYELFITLKPVGNVLLAVAASVTAGLIPSRTT